MARCPAHEDRRPSLSIRELDDGRILIHDFGGCDPGAVVAAVDLQLADLFPERIDHRVPPAKHRHHSHAAREILRLLANDALLVALAADQLAQGISLSARDRADLRVAVERINDARLLTG